MYIVEVEFLVETSIFLSLGTFCIANDENFPSDLVAL